MSIFSARALIIAALIGSAAAATKVFTGRILYGGTIGLGSRQYSPVTCAFACQNSVSGWMLDCGDSMDGMPSMEGMSMTPAPQCYANNDPYLQTLAWCIHTHCPADLSLSELEAFWELNIAGRILAPPAPKYSYQAALSRVTSPPTAIVNSSLVLNTTSLVSPWLYTAQYGSLAGIEANISLDNQYTLVVILACSLAPILFSLARFLPLPQSVVSKIYAYAIDPPVFGSRHAVPAFIGLGIVPTRGQALFILYIWAINIILSAVNYQVYWPNLWFSTMQMEMADYISIRTGMLSFGNFALAVLFASRNNFLLWVTDWSRSTFVIIHRWIAFICILQACIHSALFLQLQLWQGASALATESAYAYWYWGVIATWALVLVLPLSLLPIRQRAYEFFLAWHNLFVLLAIIASFLHIFFRYHWQWGYEIWVCVIFSIWVFDRVVARPLRLACNGCHRQAFVSVIDGDYLKLEIPGADAKGQAFLYFPTLTWRIWENHPFSVVPMSSGSLLSNGNEPSSSQTRGDLESGEDGKVAKPTMQSNVMHRPRPQSPGIAFFVRRRGGLTATLARHAEATSDGIPVLIESSYGQNAMSVLSASTTRPSLSYPNVICIAGGVGITGVLPLLDRPLLTVPGTTKLFWCVRTQPLVRAVEEMIGDRVFHGEKGTTKWGGTEVTISVGKRLLLKEVLEKELATVETKRGTTVIVCGPAGMLDEVRVCVCELARKGAVLRFVEERFVC